MTNTVDIYETLAARSDAGGSQTTTPRANTLSYMDTYSQTTYIGGVKYDDSVAYQITGKYDEVSAVNEFLKRNLDSPFWYRFYDAEPERLWEVTDGWTFRHDAGLRWQLTATFKKASMYTSAISSGDLDLFANKLSRVVNIILPSAAK